MYYICDNLKFIEVVGKGLLHRLLMCICIREDTILLEKVLHDCFYCRFNLSG